MSEHEKCRIALRTRPRISRLAVYLPLFFIALYRRFLSPLLGNNCRFYPVCSRYAEEAFCLHGFFRGGFLAITRIFCCNSLCAGGEDPVPPIMNAGESQRIEPAKIGCSPVLIRNADRPEAS